VYQTELIHRHHRSWSGRAEAERETAAWVHWYNTRLHGSLGHRPPVELEQDYRSSPQAASAPEVA
jgi:transposase InsO family protein